MNTTQTETAVMTAPKRDISALIQSDKVRQQMALVLPKHITADRMARVAITAVMRVPKLAQCTQESLLNCLMQCSQFGLEPDGRRAHLIPFENKKKGTVECTLIIDWKGLAELALRSGMIAKLHADVICDKDEFAFDMGDILHHRIDFRSPRGEPYAAYAMAVTKTGEKFVSVLTKEEIEKIRDGSQGWKSFKAGYAYQSPWQDAPGEMWKKTAFRRLSKWLPLSPEFRDAIEVDDDETISGSAIPFEIEAPIKQPNFGGAPQLAAPEKTATTPAAKKKAAKAAPAPAPEKQPEPVVIEAAPEPEPAPEPAQSEPEPEPELPVQAEAGDTPISRLGSVLFEKDIDDTQVVGFLASKGAAFFVEGSKAPYALKDIRPDKIDNLINHIKAGSTIAKEIAAWGKEVTP